MNLERLARELAAHLVLTRPLVCVDLEATGVSVDRDRIVQIAAASIFPDGGVTTWSSLVNPEQPIPAEVTNVHGITDAMVASAPTFAQLAPIMTALLSGCDLAGYNIEKFDRRLLAAECRRVGVADPTSGARSIDAYAIYMQEEPRTLDGALRFYGVQDAGATRRAHEANSDVEAAVAVLVAQLRTYPDVPRTVEALHEWLYPADPDRIDADGKLRWNGDVATIGFGAQAGRSLADLAANDRGFLDWILRKDFSDEVKTIIREALAGRFPVRSNALPQWSNPIRLT
jgi:DNA polymerase-3 subunit epsilon